MTAARLVFVHGRAQEGKDAIALKAEWIAAWRKGLDKGESLSWTVVEHIIKHSRVGCVPGLDFGPASEGYIRFCTCRDRKELSGALESMRTVFA